jgi:hypothetical protein
MELRNSGKIQQIDCVFMAARRDFRAEPSVPAFIKITHDSSPLILVECFPIPS